MTLNANNSSVNSLTPFQFTGSAGEYFRIWIVNLCLSIISLGIYSAWAKVRRMKYFYQNTKIAGVGFDYHANPMAILKGRVIAFTLFLTYSVLAKLHPIIAIALAILLMFATPWVVIRGLTFNARNTSHRGLRFDFKGDYKQMVMLFVVYPILLVLSLGLLYPKWVHSLNTTLISKHRFGTSAFSCKASAKEFYKIYVSLLLAVLAVGLVLNVLVPELDIHFILERLKSGPSGVILLIGTISLIVIIELLLTLTVISYIKTRTSNLIWNTTTLDNLSFTSTQRMHELAWLYATNVLALIATIGLATPWAKIRLMKYRLEHLACNGTTDWDNFVGEKKEQMRSTGEEIAEFFDVDISFG